MSVASTVTPSVTWNDVTFTSIVTDHDGVDDVTENRVCGNHTAPTAYWFLQNLDTKKCILLVLYSIITFITFIIYLDETVFIIKRFRKSPERCWKTIWVLTVFPVFSLTGLLGFMIPLAAPVVDLVSNTLMATCLYNLLELMMCYIGGTEGLWSLVEEGQLSVQYATLPVCCLLPCLPNQKMNKLLLWRLRIMVLQVCILRPIIMFIAAVMWANGSYTHEGMNLKTADPYITIINATTTIVAVYGLNLVKTALIRPLKGFWLGGKVFIIQMVLATCSLTPAITRLFHKWGAVRCDPIYTESVHLDSIYRGVLVVSMLIYSITARFLYRIAADADRRVVNYIPEPDPDLKTNIKRMLNMPRDALSYLKNSHRKKRKSTEAHNGNLAGNDSYMESHRSWSTRKSDNLDDGQLCYIEVTVDETTSLTIEMEDSDTDAGHICGVLHVNINESLMASSSD